MPFIGGKDEVMNNLKRLLCLLVAAASLISFSACGNNDESESDNINGSAEQSQNVPLFINDDWTYGQVAMGGGGFVSGVFSTPEQNLFYARTDVGGAYRWDSELEQWVSISSFVSEMDKGLLGIDGLAFDPSAPNKVYLLAGTDYFSDGKTAVLRSDDYGKTFEQTDVTNLIKVHGNGNLRGSGERIAVDPNDGDIIFAGGRTGGLIKSTDGGKSWSKVESLAVNETESGAGINGIVFDPSTGEKGKATQRIYVTVARSNDSNVYVSEDGGKSWNPVEGFPTQYEPYRSKLDSEGNLYITFGESSSYKGGLYRLNASDKSVEDISPVDKSMGDVVIDPENPQRLVACTIYVWSHQPNGGYGDEFYTSEDGGKTWRYLNEDMKISDGGIEWINGYAIHWAGSLAMDPYNTNTVMVISGNGIFRCDNIWDESPEFYFFVRGLEETVPFDCISIPGGTLFTAIGDYDGFDNTDVNEYGRYHTTNVGTTTSIAVAGLDPNIRVKLGGSSTEQQLLYTEDGGETWTFITNSPEEGKVMGGGKVAVTADGKTIIWCPSDNLNSAYYTTDRGATWNKVIGIRGGYYVIADPVNPDYVYANGQNGFMVSSNGGQTFSAKSMLSNIAARVTVSAGQEGVVYIPCNDFGLFVSNDHGKTVTKINTVENCLAVGVGKGKTDDAQPVLYVFGKVKDQPDNAIYMSEDGGETWERVNDDLHQYGGVGNGGFIVGDNNIYGRCYMGTVGLGLAYFDKIDKN